MPFLKNQREPVMQLSVDIMECHRFSMEIIPTLFGNSFKSSIKMLSSISLIPYDQ